MRPDRGDSKNHSRRIGRFKSLSTTPAINIRKLVTDFTLDEWRQVMDTNLPACSLMCRAFVRNEGQGYGRIINMTSIMSHVCGHRQGQVKEGDQAAPGGILFETSLRIANGRALVVEMDTGKEHLFSNKFAFPICAIAAGAGTPRLFSFKTLWAPVRNATAWAI